MIRPLLVCSLLLSLITPVRAASPIITGFSPAKGNVGTQVRIFGSNFAGLTEVDFFTGGSGGAAAIIGFNGSTIIDVVVPPDAHTGPLTVSTVGGSDSSSAFFQPSPRITDFYTQLDPFTGSPVTPVKGTVSQRLVLRGFNFNDYNLNNQLVPSAVFVGGVRASYQPTADNQIVLDLPAGGQTGSLVVSNSAGMAISGPAFSGGLIYFNPVVSQFQPVAPIGATVDILGQSLLGATEVRFGSLAAAFTVLAGTHIQAVVPAGATDARLTVTSPGGSFITLSNFLVAPTIGSFTPAGGPVGTLVTLTGSALNNTRSVQFGAVAATKFTNINATTVTAVVPAGSFTAPLTVITGNGTNTSSVPFFLAPSLAGISPLSGPIGTVVTLTGANFTGATKLELAGSSVLPFTVANTNRITVAVLAGAVSGKWRVTTPGGMAESADSFTVIGPVPSISGFAPTTGPAGTPVTISGANLTSATQVEFNGVAARSLTVNLDGSISAVVPATATSGPLRVTTPAGQATSAASFIVGTSADLKVTLTASLDPAVAYSGLNFAVQLVNRGPLAAANARLTFTLPAGTTFHSVTGTQNYENLGRTVVFNLGTLAPNGGFSAGVGVIVGAPATLMANLQATSDTPDSVPANNLAAVSVPAALPVLSLERFDTASIVLQWPSPATNFVLEGTVLLQTPSLWRAVGTNLPDDDGVTRQLILQIITNSYPSVFFRLRLNQ